MSELFAKFQDGRQQVWDASTLEDAWKCMWFYKARNIDRWFAKSKRISADFGTKVHTCLEVFDATLLGHSHAQATDAALCKALELAVELRPLPGEEPEDTARTPEALVRAVLWYIDKFKDGPFRLATLPDGSPALEVRFELAIPGRDYRVSGRIDRLVWYNDGLYLVDRKTTKKTLNAAYWSSFLPGVQIPTYLWATRKLGMEPKGIIIEACQTMTSGARWSKQQFDIPSSNLEEFERDLIAKCDEVAVAHTTGVWTRNRAVCNLYGGCLFRKVCNAETSQRHRWLADAFEQRPYTPSGHLPVEPAQEQAQ